MRKLRNKQWKDRRSKKLSKKKRSKKSFKPSIYVPQYRNYVSDYVYRAPVEAPNNLCLLEKTEDCLNFFSKLRSEKNVSKAKNTYYVNMSLTDVKSIDYSTVCVLIAIIGDLKSKNVYTRILLPKDKNCKKEVIDSGLLNVLYDEYGKPFKKSDRSDFLFIEKGSKKLTREDNIQISDKVKNVVKHLTGEYIHCRKLRTILLEICGNSIEWGGTKNRQWLIGIKYDDDRVIFTITDVGKGILNSLYRKFGQKLNDVFSFKSNDEILKGAFIKKYASSSQQINRNKGLPAIKGGFDEGLIDNLKVLTNDVILHYDNEILSKVIKGTSFEGTLYRWVVTNNSIKKAS